MKMKMNAALFYLLMVVAITVVSASFALSQQERGHAISRFIASREVQGLVCLYTFDRYQSAVNISTSGNENVGQDTVGRVIPPRFENEMVEYCPFGDLQFDPTLVSTPGSDVLKSQLGVHIAEDPSRDAKKPQIASNEVVPAKDFFKATMEGGLTFEIIFRRRIERNQSMTLFSIGNLFGDCVDLGIRLEMTTENHLVLLYHVPVLHEKRVWCYERRHFSSGDQGCELPTYRDTVDNNPVVHLTVTMDAMEAMVGFYMVFVDPVTLERHKCSVLSKKKPLEDKLFYDYIQGTQRLFIGNNPHNVSSPLNRSRLAAARQYRDPFLENLPPEQRLRALIRQKLDAIQGPRLPSTLRVFAGNTLSFEILGIPLPALSEDTPYAIIRSAIDSFKEAHGDDIVEFIVKSLKLGNQLKKKDPLAFDDDDEDEHKNKTIVHAQYPDSNGSSFDLFQFALYNRSLSADVITKKNWDNWMTAFRPFLEQKRVVHTMENQKVELDLLQLHSVYEDVCIEIIELPELGNLVLYSDNTTLTNSTLPKFRDLSSKQQQKIYFVPRPHENNKNLPRRDKFDYKRTLEAYAKIRFKVWKTTTGRPLNTSSEGVIEVFVDPFDGPPRLQPQTRSVILDQDAGFLELSSRTSGSRQISGRYHSSTSSAFDRMSHLLRNSTLQQPNRDPPHQNESLRIVKFPRYGRLYDPTLVGATRSHDFENYAELSDYESLRIRQDSVGNRTFSTSIHYVRDRHVLVQDRPPSLDVLQYQLRVGDSRFSEVGTVELRLPQVPEEQKLHEIVVSTVYVDEDSTALVELRRVEPLIGLIHPIATFKITSLPAHGRLYQYGDASNASLHVVDSIGASVRAGDIVGDYQGRVLYVPSIHFSTETCGDMDACREVFTYEIVANQDTGMVRRNKTWLLPNVSVSRTVRMHVANVEDKMSFLPPTILSASAKRGESVNVPVLFEDPDQDRAVYRVVLETSNGLTKFVLHHPVTDDDVLKYCSFERPCILTQNSDGSFSTTVASAVESPPSDSQLRFLVKNRNWDPSLITMEASKGTMLKTLSKLKIQDWTMLIWDNNHTVKFDVTIERLTGTQAKRRMAYYVDYAAAIQVGEDDGSFGSSMSKLFESISVMMWIGLFCFLLSSATCCSFASCCCCCSRARAQRRLKFEEDQRRYLEQVVQNDQEYSTLLMGLFQLLLEPDLRLCTRLIRASEDPRSPAFSTLTIFNVLRLLETEQQEISLILRLVFASDTHRRRRCRFVAPRWSRSAGLATALFCRVKGRSWLQSIVASIKWCNVTEEKDTVTELFSAIERNVSTMPTELVVLVRALSMAGAQAKLGTRGGGDVGAQAFFEHFLFPAIWFPSFGIRLPGSQRQLLRKAVAEIVRCQEDPGSPVASCYGRLLLLILTSPVLSDSLDMTSKLNEEDAALIAVYLMNVHSILEHVMPSMSGAPGDGEEDGTINKAKLLLRALNFPIANAQVLALVLHAGLASDEMLWCDLHPGAWQSRVMKEFPTRTRASSRRRRPARLRTASSLLSFDFNDDESSSTATYEASSSTTPTHADDRAFEF